MSQLPDIYDYLDYRDYLKQVYLDHKSLDKKYSYRFFGEKWDVDPGFMVKVFQKKKHFKLQVLTKIAETLSISKRERQFLLVLFQYSKAKDEQEIKHYFEQLLRFSEVKKQPLLAAQFEFYEKWEYSAVREALRVLKISTQYRELGLYMVPPLSEARAKNAVELLLALQMIERDETGVLMVKDDFITNSSEIPAQQIRDYQKLMMTQAQAAVDCIAPSERDISSLTFNLSEAGFLEVKEKIQSFREEILEIVQQEDQLERVYQFNFQLFPMSQRKRGSRDV